VVHGELPEVERAPAQAELCHRARLVSSLPALP
jgi:hypothetical protein